MKKLSYIFIIFLLLFQAACSNKSGGNAVDKDALENLTDSGMPIVKEPLTLKMMSGMSKTTQKNWDDILIWNTYQDMTNIKVEWDQIAGDALEEKRNLALASGEFPDVFYASNLPTLDIYKYGQKEVFLKLNDLIEDHAPNLKKLMEENPDIRKAITFPDGNIYSLPVIHDPDFISVRTHPLPWFKKDTLDQLGMDVPETTEELYQYFKKVKEETDLIPYGSWNMAGFVAWLRGAYGIGTTGRDFIDKDPETGDVRFYVNTDRYKEMLEFLHKLYSEGLIEQNIYTIDWGQFLSKGTEGDYASMMFYAPTELFGQEAGKQYVAGVPLEGPHGDRKFAQLAHPVGHIGKFIITNKNPNPYATMRWIDHFYSDEGSKLFYMGVEGETYEETADGKFKYLEKITNSSEGLSKEQEIAKYLGWIGIGAPGILKQKYFDGSEGSAQSLEGAEKVKPYLIDEVWPPFTYTDEEAKKLSALSADIEKYVTEMRDKFIVGETPLSKWDEYVANLEKMGLEDYMKIQKVAYERYKKN